MAGPHGTHHKVAEGRLDRPDDQWRRALRERRRQRRQRRRGAAIGALVIVLGAGLGTAIAAGSGGGHTAAGIHHGKGSSHTSHARTPPAGHAGARPAGRAGAPPAGHAGARRAGGSADTNRAGEPETSGPRAPAAEPSRRVAVPILMYHVINSPPAGAPFPGLYVPAAEFSEQMAALARAGFVAVTLDQVWSHWRDGTPLPRGRPVVITFDNGYRSQYTNALPVLRRLGWRAVENMQLTGLPPSQGGLSEAQVRGLISAGWEINTQGFSHAELTMLSTAELRYQVATSRATLQHRYHLPVHWFCYPSGHYNQAVITAVRAAGYTGSTTVSPGWATPEEDPYRLPRLRVLAGTTGSDLIALIEGSKADPPPPAAYE